MIDKVFLFLFLNVLSCISALPTRPQTTSSEIGTDKAATASSVDLIVNPEMISIENLETLLRQAGEIFLPANLQLVEGMPDNQQQQQQQQPQQKQQVPVPYRQMQPPTDQPYNFYLPLFQFDQTGKRDDMSRKLEHFIPPPVPSKEQQSINYYAIKPKKMPKKFIGGSKHINMNWLVDLEKQAAGKAIDFSKAAYLVNDERNRINFDDTFFGVDMLLKVPDNQPHKVLSGQHKTKGAPADFFNNGEELAEDGEDLIAAPTLQLAQVVFNNRGNERKL